MRLYSFAIVALGLLIASPSVCKAQAQKILVFPIEAIADSAELTKEEFQERYPGIDISQYGLMDEGWYVRYQHELLAFFYGPVNELNTARKQKALLEEIRLNLVLKNPKLSSSRVDIIEFRFNNAPAGSGKSG